MPALGPVELLIVLFVLTVLVALLVGAALVLRAVLGRRRATGHGDASRLADLEARLARLEDRA